MRYIFDFAVWYSNIHDGESLRLTELLAVAIPHLEDVKVTAWRNADTRDEVS
jgi:hypothetical protein